MVKTVGPVLAGTPMPNLPWNNYSTVMFTFFLKYAETEGLSLTSALARKVLLYVFHGSYNYTKAIKKVKRTFVRKILHGIHWKTSNGQTRCLNKVPTAYKAFLDLLRAHPEYKTFLSDKGDGNPPPEYLAAFEEGLRNYACDKHSMGGLALDSTQQWDAVAQWRKRESYICLCRVIDEKKGCKWTSTTWSFWIWRSIRCITFNKRHWPLCQKSIHHFAGQVDLLSEWSKKPKSNKPPRKSKTKVTTKSSPPTNEAAVSMMYFDADAGCLVPYDVE
jgi:hypothetical protein